MWTTIHRKFVAGESLASYSRTLPGSTKIAGLVDLTILCVSLQIFVIPVAVAIWIAVQSHSIAGSDGLFPAYLISIFLLTISVAKSTVYGPRISSKLSQTVGFVALTLSNLYVNNLLALITLIASQLFLFYDLSQSSILRRIENGPPTSATFGYLRPYPILFMLRLQCTILYRQYLLATLSRTSIAIFPQFAACWLIFSAGKHQDARVFLIFCCGFTTAVMSGFYFTFFEARKNMRPFIRSLPLGPMRVALAENMWVVSATAAVFLMTFSALCFVEDADSILRRDFLSASAYSLLWLPLLGLDFIQQHKDAILIKFTIIAASLIIAFNLC